MMKRAFALVMVAFLVVPVALQAAESPVLDRVLQNRELRVGTSGDQAPFNAINKEGELIGLEVDLARMLAEAMNVSLTLMSIPFPDLLPALKEGEVDMVLSGIAITPERSRNVAFIGPYLLSGKSVLTDSETLLNMERPRDLNKPELTLVALENSTSQRYLERVAPKAKHITTKDYDAAVKMILDDSADAMIADMPICVLTVLRNPNKDLATPSSPLNVEPIGVALSAEDLRFQNLISNYIQTFEMTGLLDELRKKWLEDSSWVQEVR